MGPKINDYVSFFFELLNGERVRYEMRIVDARDSLAAQYLDTSLSLKILDLGSGQLRPQFELLKAQGHLVVGADLANRPDQNLNEMAYRFARWLYRRRIPGKRPGGEGSGLLCADVCALPLPGNTFDLATSIAAFEHFLDVPAVIAEIYRVLRPGGIFFCGIHPFTALSGGHNVQFMSLPITQMPPGVEPWDHLRRRKLPFHVPLNEWRIHQYLDEFNKHFEILKHYPEMIEGEGLLTPQILDELNGYSREELIIGSYIIFARKGSA